jgi:hypothetical protein
MAGIDPAIPVDHRVEPGDDEGSGGETNVTKMGCRDIR